MPTAAALLMIASVLGAPESAVELEPAALELAAPDAEATTLDASEPTTGVGDPLYDRLFAQAEGPEATESSSSPSLPQLPPWLWVLGMAGLAGLYYTRKRKVAANPSDGQVEVLGHTRMGGRSRLTVIRVAGEDGKMRRLLVSTGEGTPSLVADLGAEDDGAQAELAAALAPLPQPTPAPPPAPPPAAPA